MYHRIVSADCPVPGDDPEEARYAVALDEFRRQMGVIAAAGRRGVSMGMVLDSLDRNGRVPADWVVLTFDDGNRSDYVHALPLVKDSGFSATFFVGGDRIGADGGVEPAMLAEMATDGMEIGSHGMTHRFLTTLDETEEEDELGRSKELLERVSGVEVRVFAPPGGRIGRRGMAALRKLTYSAVCTSPRARFEQFVEAAAPRLLPLYARDRALRLVRRTLGESRYRRIRSIGLES
jgi:peptidoglycan/xylan/chitin deacetylase (PgdA/CDA1 family)